MAVMGSNLLVPERGRESPESAHLARCPASPEGLLTEPTAGAQPLTAGTRPHAPHLPFAIPVGIGSIGRGAVVSTGVWIDALRGYSITSLARASSNCGTVRSSALAAFRLMTSSNVVGCSNGSSAGFSPFKTRTT